MTGTARHTEHLPSHLAGPGLILDIGPFTVRLVSPMAEVADAMALFYDEQCRPGDADFADFHIRVSRPRNARRWYRPQVNFYVDDLAPFKPLPAAQAYPFFEWGLNWCIAQHAHHYLMIHAAVVETGGRVLVLPGAPGSGKSTLCAALVCRGWRLLSDEFALVSLADGTLSALPRPVSLKNESIAVIRSFAPDAVIGPAALDTAKGTVAHLKPPPGTVQRAREAARPAWIMFPRYEQGARTRLARLGKGQTLMQLVEDSFNYNLLGAAGFEAGADLVDGSACFELSYGDLTDVVERLNSLATAEG